MAAAGTGASNGVEAAHRCDPAGGDRRHHLRAARRGVRRRRGRGGSRDRHRTRERSGRALAAMARGGRRATARAAERLSVPGETVSDRYGRQTILPEVGEEGQARLAAATVLTVGAGGLGCAALQYLTAAGIGRLIVVDHDRVEESNLHRQPLYRMSDIGQPKVYAARSALAALNP